MGLAVMKAETPGCNNSDHVTILQILNAGWWKSKVMDLYIGGTLFRSSPDTGCPERLLRFIPLPLMLLNNFS
jgi:hypothetical protein